jgi:hypothetical protein
LNIINVNKPDLADAFKIIAVLGGTDQELQYLNWVGKWPRAARMDISSPAWDFEPSTQPLLLGFGLFYDFLLMV